MSKLKQYGIGILLFVVIFAIIGIGLGFTGYITVDMGEQMFGANEDTQSGDGGSMEQAFATLFVVLILFQSAIIIFFAGPIIAGFTGAIAGIVTPNTRQGAILGGAGSFIGFYPMALLALLIMFMAFDTGAGGGGGGTSGESSLNLGSMLGRLVIGGLPTGIVGAVTGALGSKL
jgi:hypothetical protein